MKLRLGLAVFALVLSATAFGHDANWWYEKYQKVGQTDPKWDSLVREGMDHSDAAAAAKTDRERKAELALTARALEKAYEAGCRCPIALFIDGCALAEDPTNFSPAGDRYHESLARTENRPDLHFVRIPCADNLAWRYLRWSEYPEAIRYFELALSLSSPDVPESVINDAKSGLQQAREKLAAKLSDDAERSRRVAAAAAALPPNPTREQARAYVRRIIFVILKRKQGGFDNSEVALLEKVRAENLDVLLETWGAVGAGEQQNWLADSFIKDAVDKLARAEDRPLLLKWAPLQDGVAEVMQKHGWVQDMRAFLLARIAEHSTYEGLPILRAGAALRDPAAYGDLLWHFENNANGSQILADLKDLPDIQLKDAVARKWAQAKSWTDWRANNRYGLAVAAMDYGVTDALEFAIEKSDSPASGAGFSDVMREAVRKHTGLTGSDDEIRAWFKANKEKLVFDEQSRMFRPNP